MRMVFSSDRPWTEKVRNGSLDPIHTCPEAVELVAPPREKPRASKPREEAGFDRFEARWWSGVDCR